MKSDTLIHIGFQYNEAITAKKDLLSLEMDLLEMAKSFTRYYSLRSEELRLKVKLYLKIRELMANFRKLKRTLPKLQLPKILQEEKELDMEKIKEEKEITYGPDIDSQLKQIQDKLRALQE